MNDNMPTLRITIDESLARRLPSHLLAMLSRFGQVSTPVKTLARRPPVPSDTPGLSDAGRDIGGGQGPIA